MKTIIIIIDCLRRDHLSFYGYERKTSPNIDEIAKTSDVYVNWNSIFDYTPSCFYSLFSGKEKDFKPLELMPPNEYWLKDIYLKKYAIMANCVMEHQVNFQEEFDEYLSVQGHAKIVAELARTFLRKKDNYLAIIHFNDCHMPYRPPNNMIFSWTGGKILGTVKNFYDKGGVPVRFKEYLSSFNSEELKARYDGAIKWIDFWIGKNIIPLLNFSIDNLIILGDHGEAMGEDDYWYTHHINKPFTCEVPMIVKTPFTEGRIINENKNHKDFQKLIEDILSKQVLNVWELRNQHPFNGIEDDKKIIRERLKKLGYL